MKFDYGEYWADMDFDVRDAYVEHILSGRSSDTTTYYWPSDGPRPHGSEKLDSKIRILDYGIEQTPMVAARLRSLGFGFENYEEMERLSKTPNYKFSSYIITNGNSVIDRKKMDWKSKIYDLFSGWDSSYHDARWNGLNAIVGYGSTPEIAEKNRNELLSRLIPGDDPSVKRFKLRRMVREGD